MLAGSCGAAMPRLRCGYAPSCPHVWMTVGPMASASCCAPTTTCMRPASARLVSGLGCGAGDTGDFWGIGVASKGAVRNWVWGQGEHNCLLNPRCLLSSSTLYPPPPAPARQGGGAGVAQTVRMRSPMDSSCCPHSSSA